MQNITGTKGTARRATSIVVCKSDISCSICLGTSARGRYQQESPPHAHAPPRAGVTLLEMISRQVLVSRAHEVDTGLFLGRVVPTVLFLVRPGCVLAAVLAGVGVCAGVWCCSAPVRVLCVSPCRVAPFASGPSLCL